MGWSKLYCPKLIEGIEFRDLEAFNLALLAKQGWRLINGPPSLFQTIFKGKYFPLPSSQKLPWAQIPHLDGEVFLKARKY